MPIGPDCVVKVRVTSRSERPDVEVDGDLGRIRVADAPVELPRQPLAATLGIPRAAVVLTAGSGSKIKHSLLIGLGCSQVQLRFGD